MKKNQPSDRNPFHMEFDVSTIKHLGVQMYSTLPPVIGEFVANAWDANATRVEITIPEGKIADEESEIIISDDGIGMSDMDIREKYLIVGRNRREQDESEKSPPPQCRVVMGRKGIGKFSAFGIARVIEIESAKESEVSRFIMDYDMMEKYAKDRVIAFESLQPTGTVLRGTTIKLRNVLKFKSRRIPIDQLRKKLARRFSVVGTTGDFLVFINGREISLEERDLKRLLDRDADGPYLWEFKDEKIEESTNLTVSGWIGALKRTDTKSDHIERGISILARGKLVQEPFVFDAVVGQQYALSYFVGEVHAEFVDQDEDTVATSRNELVWDSPSNVTLKHWGQQKVNKLAREWSERRSKFNEQRLMKIPLYRDFEKRAYELGNKRSIKLALDLVRQAIRKNPTAEIEDLRPIVQTSLDFLEFDKFRDISQDLAQSELSDVARILDLFREWEVIEAMEMSRVTEGRVVAIEKLQELIDTNALEVPDLHQFLKEFPWALDPRWTLVGDEVSYSDLLRQEFPESDTGIEVNRRIDFLCIREAETLVVVEIKRPASRVSSKDLRQIGDYVHFMRNCIEQSTDSDVSYKRVIGYLFCGDVVNEGIVRQDVKGLERDEIYVRKYVDLLEMVRRLHAQFIKKYDELKKLRASKQ